MQSGKFRRDKNRMKKIVRGLVSFVILMIIILFATRGIDFNKIERMFFNRDVISTQKDLIRKIRSAMLDYKEDIKIKYVGDYDKIKDIARDPLNYVCEIDDPDTSNDYDYLKYIIKSMNVRLKGYGDVIVIEYQFTYRETKEQTKEVNDKIKEVFKELDINNLSDYEKIKEIHDYIINNTEYDLSYKKVTAYDNLINKGSVCQGYAALTYKMMIEAGIPCRIINGMSAKETHAWNIVKLDGVWYNIDCTWDDPITQTGEQMIIYQYFLKSEEDFKDHFRDKDYKTKGFLEKYKIADESYTME